MQTCFFVDGFNLYHALDASSSLRKYKWLNLHKLAQMFLKADDVLGKVYYFTALATWDFEKVQKHQIYIEALRSVGVETVYGEFRRKDVRCLADCRKLFRTYAEKETDVNIAVQLFQSAFKNEFDRAILVTGDSDLVPAIRKVQETFPNKEIGVIIPIGRHSELIKLAADFHMRLKEKHLSAAQFSDQIEVGGKVLSRPLTWV